MNPFARTKPEKIEADLLYEAKRHLVEHEALAEYHAAQAAMYRSRIARLEPMSAALSVFASNAAKKGN